MSENLSNSKKLEIRSELLRHLETAKAANKEGKPSTSVKVWFLQGDLANLDEHGVEPTLEFWRKWLV